MTIQLDMVYQKGQKAPKLSTDRSTPILIYRWSEFRFPSISSLGPVVSLVKLVTLWHTVLHVIYILSWYNEYFMLYISCGYPLEESGNNIRNKIRIFKLSIFLIEVFEGD